MINCEYYLIVLCVVSPSFQFNFNKLYPISLAKIVEITYAVSGTLQNTIGLGICHKKIERARD